MAKKVWNYVTCKPMEWLELDEFIEAVCVHVDGQEDMELHHLY